MIRRLYPGEFVKVRNFIERICGISIAEDKAYLIESRLSGLLSETGFRGYGDFLESITSGNKTEMKERIIDSITTNETLWFRDQSPWFIQYG